MSKNEENWLANYEALKAHILKTGHFPNKHDKRLNWAKFQMKKIKAGTLEPERQRLFEELMAMRSGEHTGGRRRAAHDDDTLLLRCVPLALRCGFGYDALTLR